MVTSRELLAAIKKKISEISPVQFKALRERNPHLLVMDVREPDEWAKGILPGAKMVARGFLELKMEEIEPDRKREIVVYCGGGNRSALAAESLGRLGYEKVHSLAGGFTRWLAEKNELETKTLLTETQRERYHRHMLLPEVGEEGQFKLLRAKVAVIGAGGLGCPVILYLAAAGVGTLGIIDDDVVDRSNLQRQVLYTDRDIGRKKVTCAQERIAQFNPDVRIIGHDLRLSRQNALSTLEGYDVVVNGCDNFPTRYLVNDACYFLKKPLVDGSIFRFEGQASLHIPDRGPCYRCLYPEPPPPELAPSCQEAGVFGVLPGIVGAIQGIETIKLILGLGDSLVGRLIQFDSKRVEFRELKLRKDPQCPLCGTNPTVKELIDYEGFCGLR